MVEDVGRSAVLRALPILRNWILETSDGAFIGSEADLIERIGISAPTLRQVARLLEHEELLVIKRGVGGGFFGRRPSADTVARSAALFLSAQNTPPEDIYNAAQAINAELMRRAALSTDEVGRANLAKLLDHWRAWDKPPEREAFMIEARRLTDLMADIAGNAPLALFIKVFRYISLTKPGVLSHYYEAAEQWRTLYLHVGQAILDHDPEAAVRWTERISELAAGWSEAEKAARA